MSGLFNTSPGPWRISGEYCPECWFIETNDGDFIAQCEDRRGFASLDAVINSRAIAQVPAMLELVTMALFASDQNTSSLKEAARKIVAELEKK